MNRRAFLAGGIAAVGLLAGCGGDGGERTTGRSTSETATTPVDDGGTPTTAATPSGPSTATPNGSATTSTGSTTTAEQTTMTDGPGIRNPGFEEGLAGWTVGRDLPEDPNNPGNEVASEATTTTRVALNGERSLSLSIDGRQDDGTLWVQQRSHLADVESLTVDVFSPGESFNTISKVAAYAGPVRRLSEGAFDTDQPVENHEGWRSYTYPVAHGDVGLVAVGISVVWETAVTRFLDDVTLVRSE